MEGPRKRKWHRMGMLSEMERGMLSRRVASQAKEELASVPPEGVMPCS